jgi:hypothetical protein
MYGKYPYKKAFAHQIKFTITKYILVILKRIEQILKIGNYHGIKNEVLKN